MEWVEYRKYGECSTDSFIMWLFCVRTLCCLHWLAVDLQVTITASGSSHNFPLGGASHFLFSYSLSHCSFFSRYFTHYLLFVCLWPVCRLCANCVLYRCFIESPHIPLFYAHFPEDDNCLSTFTPIIIYQCIKFHWNNSTSSENILCLERSLRDIFRDVCSPLANMRQITQAL